TPQRQLPLPEHMVLPLSLPLWPVGFPQAPRQWLPFPRDPRDSSAETSGFPVSAGKLPDAGPRNPSPAAKGVHRREPQKSYDADDSHRSRGRGGTSPTGSGGHALPQGVTPQAHPHGLQRDHVRGLHVAEAPVGSETQKQRPLLARPRSSPYD